LFIVFLLVSFGLVKHTIVSFVLVFGCVVRVVLCVAFFFFLLSARVSCVVIVAVK
jgi:hypothetical protein